MLRRITEVVTAGNFRYALSNCANPILGHSIDTTCLRYPQKLFDDTANKGAWGMRHDLYEFQVCSSRYLALYSPDEEPLYRSKYYVLGLSIHMGDDTQRLRSAGTMQKY